MISLIKNNKKWFKYKNRNAKVSYNNNNMIIKNDSNSMSLVYLPKIFKAREKNINIEFSGNVIEGSSAILVLINRKREVISEFTINSKTVIENPEFKYFIPCIRVLPNTTVEISDVLLDLDYKENISFKEFTNDTLILSPSYPSEEHRYMSGFVHSRVKEYKKNGINVDVAVVYDHSLYSNYTMEGINVTRMTMQHLRTMLQKKHYKNILVHFFDEKYFNVFEGLDIEETNIYIWVHGPETLYWASPLFTTTYFSMPRQMLESERDDYKKKDKIIEKVNNLNNVKWVFVSNWIKDESEKLLKIKFNNYVVIPNIVDSSVFKYNKKTKKVQKNIFMLRRFDNINKYAIDIAVRAIVELSKRENFDEYTFNIYGTGYYYDELISPIKDFANVNLFPGFYTHKQIADIHKENGIALFPTRYDAQGVSMCEAGSSGLVVISSENEAIKEFISSDFGNIIDTENYVEYANAIERISNDYSLFSKASKNISDKIVKDCSYESTVAKEIKMINDSKTSKTTINKLPRQNKDVTLSIVIPSYNVEQYVVKTLKTLTIDNKNVSDIEIIVVNDGSKDNTVKVVKDFMKKHDNTEKPIIRLIDKENGGHGSTINVGIKLATGKYFRIIDGDDWVKTEDFEKLIDVLKTESSDIVVTDYSEDRMDFNSQLIKKTNYEFMVPGLQYHFNDIAVGEYGFKQWGPILATTNVRTDKLREADFKISEKMFYVDMEFNAFYLPTVNTISYYPLDVYRYFIGRVNQSISHKSYIRNIDQHEQVIKNIVNFINSDDRLSLDKKIYINNNILIPMINAHYMLLTNDIRNRKKFVNFDNFVVNNFKEHEKLISKRIKLLRKTKGFLINILHFIRRGN